MFSYFIIIAWFSYSLLYNYGSQENLVINVTFAVINIEVENAFSVTHTFVLRFVFVTLMVKLVKSEDILKGSEDVRDFYLYKCSTSARNVCVDLPH